jgi:CBS domain-containing protein
MSATFATHTSQVDSLDSIRVAETMHRGLVTCRPETSLHAVARIMAAHRMHAVVVTPVDGTEEWTLVSDLDLAAAFGENVGEALTAAHIASTPNLFVAPDESVARAAQLMREYETHHLIVVDRRHERPVGVISTLDIADVIAELRGRTAPRTTERADDCGT